MSAALRRTVRLAVVIVGAATVLAGCGTTSSSSRPGSSPFSSGGSSENPGTFVVIAGENFWGSIASQLAGDKATVHSLIVDPNTDPHSYQPTARDARTIAAAKMAIVNGTGYDNWMPQALAASPLNGRVTLTVGELLGLKEGDNPHQWYSPAGVMKVVEQIVADYQQVDVADSAYFAQRKQAFQTQALGRYNQLRAEIRAKYSGVPIGYSESIFQPLGQDLGLKMLTPYSFTKAIAEGTNITAQDKQTVNSQTQNRQIKVWIYNRQNATPDVQRISAIARANHIPIATVTETLSPASASFQQWQVSQLQGLAAALHQATGK